MRKLNIIAPAGTVPQPTGPLPTDNETGTRQ